MVKAFFFNLLIRLVQKSHTLSCSREVSKYENNELQKHVLRLSKHFNLHQLYDTNKQLKFANKTSSSPTSNLYDVAVNWFRAESWKSWKCGSLTKTFLERVGKQMHDAVVEVKLTELMGNGLFAKKSFRKSK